MKDKPQTAAKPKIFVYALSTCIWCKKTLALLEQLGASYEHVYVDTLEGAQKDSVMAQLRSVNPSCSFPTVIINDKCVIGYQEEKIKTLLKK